MRASLVRGSSIPQGKYRCSRCGGEFTFKVSRANKPAMCGDCNSVERLMARMETAA